MSILTVGDDKLFYEVKGSGPSLVFVHAGICDSRMWDYQIDFFAQSFTVIRYDLQGFGSSSFSTKPFSHTKDLLLLLEHIKIQQFHLVCCSFGCIIGFDFSLSFPSRVLSLTLVNGHPLNYQEDHPDPHPLYKDAELFYETKNVHKLAETEALMWFVGRQRTRNDVDKVLFQKIVEMDSIALTNELFHPVEVYYSQTDAMKHLSELKMPISFIVGPLDEPISVLASQKLSQLLQTDLFYVDGTAHLPNMEKPSEFNQILLSFLLNLTNIRNDPKTNL